MRRICPSYLRLFLENPNPSRVLLRRIATYSDNDPPLEFQGDDPKTRRHPDDFTGDVEKVYRILRKYHSRPPKLSLALQESGVRLRPGLVERVIRRCGDAGALGLRFFSWATRHPDYHPSHDVYKAVVRMLGKMRQFGAAWAVLDEMRRDHPDFLGPEMFVALMRRFASARMVGKAVEVLDEMPRYGCEPDGETFGCLLDALCKNGAVKDAAKLFEEMRERFPPTIKHFTSLLYGWCREARLEEAKFVLVQMRKAGFDPDIVVYNTLLGGYAAAGRMEDGYELLREMRRKECDPNATSYTTLIQALCNADRTEEAMRVFAEMKRFGCTADAITYTTLISGHCKWGRIDRACELLDEMNEQGCRPNPHTYFCIMAAHEKKEKLEECLELIARMKKSRCPPDLTIYNVAIRLACKLGELQQAAELWEEVESRDLSPGTDTFVILIIGHLQQAALLEACGHFKEMVARGLWTAPQYGTLKELLNALLRADKLPLAEEAWGALIDKGCELNVHAWTIWIHGLFTCDHVKVACCYCLDMMEAGLMPRPETFAKLMKGLKRLYNREIAAEVTEKVRKMAEERKVSFKMYKRRGVRLLTEEAEERRKAGEHRVVKSRARRNHRRGGAGSMGVPHF